MTGLSYMLGQGDALFFLKQDVIQGDILMLVGAVIYATYGVCLKRWKMPFSNWTLVYIQCVIASLFLAPLWLSSARLLPTPESIPLIGYAGMAASLLAPWLWVKSIEHIGADSSAMFMNLLPVFTIILAVLLTKEQIHTFHLIGSLVAILGVLLSQYKQLNGISGSKTSIKPTQ